MSITPTMTIGGEAVAGAATFDVTDPATGERAGVAPDATSAELDRAVEAAQAALPAWSADASARREALLAANAAIKGAAERLAEVLTAEQGKPLKNATGEVLGTASSFKYYAGLEVTPEVLQDDDNAHVVVRRRPVGPVGAITPWNFPLALAAFKLAPALAAGNTVVLKPSPYTPLATLLLGDVLRDVLPAGVLNVVSGRDPLGAVLAGHPGIRKVSFTGSVATGKAVAATAAPDLKRVTLELGGNDPAIILDDAEPTEVVKAMFWSAFDNNGQTCSAVKRVYVPASLYDDVVDAFAERAAKVRIGDGRDPASQLGPVQNARQLERVRGLVAHAVDAGAKVVVGGGAPEGRGLFFEPTILANVEDGTAVVDEEQFGPVLPIVGYGDVADAVARANATHFGLGASVWSADPERAATVAEGVEAGTVWVNAHLRMGRDQPFGGLKWSGIGLENGRYGYETFTDAQVLYRAR
jgi:acyl-CoA reductase-like NAD-dependent aldehyde dehydrogenase